MLCEDSACGGLFWFVDVWVLLCCGSSHSYCCHWWQAYIIVSCHVLVCAKYNCGQHRCTIWYNTCTYFITHASSTARADSDVQVVDRGVVRLREDTSDRICPKMLLLKGSQGRAIANLERIHSILKVLLRNWHLVCLWLWKQWASVYLANKEYKQEYKGWVNWLRYSGYVLEI